MNITGSRCETWHDVLIKHGIESSTAKSLIGFISWNKGEEFKKIGREITEVLSDYEGKVFAKDAVSTVYGDKALLFFSKDQREETANKILETIMNYEQKEVYSPDRVVHSSEREKN